MSNIKNCYLKETMPMLEKPVFIHFKLVKKGSLQFISHLDLHRTVNRALIRAGIPAWYTKGFNPHTKLVFATPLSIGSQSICEYLDIRVEREIAPAVAMERLNAELSDELSSSSSQETNASVLKIIKTASKMLKILLMFLSFSHTGCVFYFSI